MRGEAEIKRDCAMWALVAELESARAEAEGMNAANTERMSQGESLAYGEEAFHEMSLRFDDIAARLKEL